MFLTYLTAADTKTFNLWAEMLNFVCNYKKAARVLDDELGTILTLYKGKHSESPVYIILTH